MHVIIINGSPRVETLSNTDKIIDAFAEGLELSELPLAQISYGGKDPAGNESIVPAGFFYRSDTENDRS